jgi:hypothetical protein
LRAVLAEMPTDRPDWLDDRAVLDCRRVADRIVGR